MKNKKLLALILIAVLVCAALFTSCRGRTRKTVNEEQAQKVEEKLLAYKTDLEDSEAIKESNANIQSYLENWAKSKKLTHETDAAGNVIISVAASEEYADADPVVILCPYDSAQASACIPAMSTALYLAKNNEKTGKLTVIFTRETDHDFSGMKALDSKYFTDDTKVFSLNGTSKGQFSLNAAGCSRFSFSVPVERTAPSYTKAYQITMEGVQSVQANANIDSITNPVYRFRTLLADLKTSNIGYELAYINGGSAGSLSPSSASMVIVIESDKNQKFIDKMEKAVTSFNEESENGTAHPGAKYSYKETSMPETVLTADSRSSFVTFLYTLLSGEYQYNEDGDLVSVVLLNSIKTNDDSIVVGSVAYSLDPENLSAIEADEKTLCDLSDMGYSRVESIPVWNGDEECELALDVVDSYHEFSGKNMKFTDSVTTTNANFVASKNPNCQVISVSVTNKAMLNCTGTLLNYLLSSNAKE